MLSHHERDALNSLAQRAAEWLEARAAGRDTRIADEQVAEALRAFRRAERRRRRDEKRTRLPQEGDATTTPG